MIKVISKEYSDSDKVRECAKEFDFSNSFVDALKKALSEFVYKCYSNKFFSRQYVISFQFDEKKDFIDCIFTYNCYVRRKYSFDVYGNEFNFRNRNQLIDYVRRLLSNYNVK